VVLIHIVIEVDKVSIVDEYALSGLDYSSKPRMIKNTQLYLIIPSLA
jgi:hypothetical protein